MPQLLPIKPRQCPMHKSRSHEYSRKTLAVPNQFHSNSSKIPYHYSNYKTQIWLIIIIIIIIIIIVIVIRVFVINGQITNTSQLGNNVVINLFGMEYNQDSRG